MIVTSLHPFNQDGSVHFSVVTLEHNFHLLCPMSHRFIQPRIMIMNYHNLALTHGTIML